jgi:NAD(P)-dependent dehydrogenase (short-subunit alcohol dehydrogenase family)
MPPAALPRVALVTGAGRGLGRAAALALAAAGHRVVLVARSASQLEAVRSEIAARGGAARACPADISDPASVESVRASLAAPAPAGEWWPVTILVNAAGTFGPLQRIEESDPARWMETLRVNLLGPYLTCRAFVPGMRAAGWGRVINYSSAAALHPPGPLNSAYSVSKVALNQLTRHLAAELAGSGVTANVLHPGDVQTEMWADIRSQAAALGPDGDGYRQWVEWVETTGGDPPAKAAALVVRLAGEEAAGVTGQFLWIEDGFQAPIPSWEAPLDARPWR